MFWKHLSLLKIVCAHYSISSIFAASSEINTAVQDLVFHTNTETRGQPYGTTTSTKFAADIRKSDGNTYRIISTNLAYNGWRKIVKKEVEMPNGNRITFDVVSQGCPSVSVFVWNTNTCTATLISEYHPSVEKPMYGVVAGMLELGTKHATPLIGAQLELEEEAQLRTNNWIYLLKNESFSTSFDKYSDNALYPFLALDCEIVENGRPMDENEDITVIRDVTYPHLMQLIEEGMLNLPSSCTVMLAVNKLRHLGLPLEKSRC